MKTSYLAKIVGVLSAAVLLVVAPAWAGGSTHLAAAELDPFLRAQLRSTQKPLRVFVHGSSLDGALSAVDTAGLVLETTFERVSVVVATGTPTQILAASRLPGVTYLEGDQPIRFQLDTSNKATRAEDVVDGFAEGSQVSTALDGSGVSIAVIDEGIDGTHPMFFEDGSSKVVRNLKMVPCTLLVACTGPSGDANDPLFVDVTDSSNDSDTISIGGHGTHVAGIAAGVAVTTSNGQNLRGTAPGAKLVGVSVGMVLSVYGGAAGMNWVLEHHAEPCGAGVSASICPPIKVINNSWGSSGEYNPTSTIAVIQNALVAEGVTVVWAVGNGDLGGNGGNGSDNRVDPNAQSPTPGIIGVANYSDSNAGTRNGALDGSSSRGHSPRPITWPDISAPGTRITSACRPYLAICTSLNADPNYGTISGTSMAAPHVAGIVALLLEADPTLTPAQIEDLLEDTAFKFTAGAPFEDDPRNSDNTSSFDKGHGLVDAKQAIANIRGITLPIEVPLPTIAFSCTSDGPMTVDPEDDTFIVKFIPTNTNVPPYDPALDIREGRLSWHSGTSTLTATTRVQDMSGGLAPDLSYNVNFYHEGERFYVEGTRDPSGDHFVFGKWTMVETQGARTVIAETTGSFDVANDLVSISLSNSILSSASIAPFDEGETLTGVTFAARRPIRTDVTTVGLTEDSTTEVCQYKIGEGPASPPPPPPPPAAPTIDESNPSYSWQGTPAPDVLLPFTGTNASDCDGTYSNTNCESESVQVNLPEGGGLLSVKIETEDPDYWLVNVYGPDGSLFASGDGLGSTTVEVVGNATNSGIYKVVLRAWVQTIGTYDGTMSLLRAAPPPDNDDYEAHLTETNKTYSWEEGPVTQINNGGCGPAPDYELCDVTKVLIDVPAGGTMLTVHVLADFPDVNDIDLYVYGPDGFLVDDAENFGGDETVSANITQSGVYTIVVNYFTTVQANYQGTAQIS